jgi:hypothetical protein
VLKELVLQRLIASSAANTLKHGSVFGIILRHTDYIVIVVALGQHGKAFRVEATNGRV